MSVHDEPAGRLELVGYEKLTNHGLALPVFGRFQGANMYYTARSSAPGEADGCITGFDHYDPDSLIPLPYEQVRKTGVGEPWLDIFLWEDAPYVGTASEIWNDLANVRETIAEHAPLSLLALAEGANRDPDIQLVQKAFSWLTKRYGRQKALEWRNETYLRKTVLKGLREVGVYDLDLAIHQKHQYIIAYIGSFRSKGSAKQLTASEFRDGSHLFGKVAKALGLIPSVDLMVLRPKRTSEGAMRIAALQVAASKPHGKATTTELKNEVDRYLNLTSEDLRSSKTRPNETMYEQIVGNVVSHRASKNNIFAKGWARYTGDGIQITEAGRQYLKTLGL
jgi:hypothetical protein